MKWIEKAKTLCNKHEHEQMVKLCAVIVRGGNVLAVGYNSTVPHALGDSHAKRMGLAKGFTFTQHAEAAAVSASRNIDLSGSKLFIVRTLRSTGDLGLARPCPVCQSVIRSSGISKVIYSIAEDEYGVLRLNN